MGDNYCIEIDNSIFTLSGATLETINDFQLSKGSKTLIADFGQSISISRIMQIEANFKYAEVMVAKKLQDEGEFDEPVTVIPHWKKKMGKQSTQIFFTALPSRIYLHYTDQIEKHNDLLSLAPVFSILTNLINKVTKNEIIAVVFRHGRFADLVIGKNNQFYFASKYVAFDTSDEQISTLWETVFREISMTEKDNNIKIDKMITLDWINSKEDIPQLESSAIEQTVFNKEQITHDKTTYNISFTKALKLFPPMEGIVTDYGRLFYWPDKFFPLFLMFLLIISIMQLFGFFYYQSKTKTLIKNIPIIEDRINNLQSTISSIPEKRDFSETLQFVDTLFNNKQLPSYKDIISDISMGVMPFTTIKQLKINYVNNNRKVVISLTGAMNTEFNRAYKGYQIFLSNLKQSGYTIDVHNFNTRIDSSRFELELSRGIQ